MSPEEHAYHELVATLQQALQRRRHRKAIRRRCWQVWIFGWLFIAPSVAILTALMGHLLIALTLGIGCALAGVGLCVHDS
jgi:CHASE2 domain-containing sensor protein